MYVTLNTIITALLYSALLGGVILITFSSIVKLRLIIVTRRRLYLGKRKQDDTDKLKEHISTLLLIASNGRISVTAFFIASGILFLLTLAVGLYNLNPVQAWVIGMINGLAPYVLLRVRTWSINRRGSQEGERLVAVLLNQYRIEKYNIFETLEKVFVAGEDFVVCKTCIYRLLLEIRNTGSSERIKRATDVFARAINTNWSRMLAYNIRLAAETGMDVSSGIEDILVQLREARAIFEERKRLNAESVRIVVFLIPLLYFGSIFLAVRFIGATLPALIGNQLGTPEGFMLFFLIVLLFLLNLTLMEAVLNQKMDY